MSLIYKLSRIHGGFCHQLCRIAGHILLAKKYNLDFYIDDSEWLFTNNKGWRDYFTSLQIYTKDTILREPIYKIALLDDGHNSYPSFTDPNNYFTLNTYRDIFDEFVILTDSLQIKLKQTIDELSLKPGEYDCIMIRRGCRMFFESKYISTEKYIDVLIEKNTSTIFVQTDDYRAYEEVCEYVKNKYSDKNIRVITLCLKWKTGIVSYRQNYDEIYRRITETQNKEYVYKLLADDPLKPCDEFTSTEMKEHIEEMLLGFEICTKSRYMVIDLQSNVTRYLFIRNYNKENVITIDNPQVQCDIPFPNPIFNFY
jgi:hypothetical protein